MALSRSIAGALGAALVFSSVSAFSPAVAQSGSAPAQSVALPSPAPTPTMGGTPIPYPAYGTPAPDVEELRAKPGVPAVITLEQAVKIAVATSPVFANDNAEYAAIHAKYTSEQQALYPGLSATGTYGKSYNNYGTSTITGQGGNTVTIAPNYVATAEGASISVSQLIFDGGRTIAAIRTAKESDIAGRGTLLRNLETLRLNVANAYYAVLQDNANVTADAQLVHEFEVNEASTVAQIRNGAAARSDLAAAQYQTAQAKGQLVTAQGTAIGAQATFATTLGLDADAEVVPKAIGQEPQTPNPVYSTALKRALILRPDYLAARHNVESAKENVRYAKLARFPVLSGSASDGYSRTLYQGLPTGQTGPTPPPESPTPGYSQQRQLGLSLSVPIYDQGETNYNVAVAASQLDEANATAYQTYLQVQSDVRSALASLISARANLVQAQAEYVAARVSLDATQAQYKVGATTIINVVTAEANLSTAQAAQIAAIYGVRTAEENFLYAEGLNDIQL